MRKKAVFSIVAITFIVASAIQVLIFDRKKWIGILRNF